MIKNNYETEIPNEEKLVDEIIEKASKVLNEKYKISPVGVSVSMPGGIVKQLGIEFEINHKITKEEARYILYCAAKDFLEIINNNQQIRVHLVSYPFDFKNVEIVLYTSYKNGETIYDPLIGVAQISNEKFTYKTFEKTESLRVKTRSTEDLEEAIQAMKNKN